jgi:HK97 family phage major capsid protein
LNSSYRQNAEFIAHDNTVAMLRKVRTEAGGSLDAFAWSPSPSAGLINGEPDRFLGHTIHSSSNVASLASDAIVIGAGDFSRFFVREARGLRLENSPDYAFDKGLLTVRGILRTDSALPDATAFNRIHQATSSRAVVPFLELWRARRNGRRVEEGAGGSLGDHARSLFKV